MSAKKPEENNKKEELEIEQKSTESSDSQQNLIGFFSILLAEAVRTKPEKYLEGYKKKND